MDLGLGPQETGLLDRLGTESLPSPEGAWLKARASTADQGLDASILGLVAVLERWASFDPSAAEQVASANLSEELPELRSLLGLAQQLGFGRAAVRAAQDWLNKHQDEAKRSGVHHEMAEWVTDLDATQLLLWQAAHAVDNGERNPTMLSLARIQASQAILPVIHAASALVGADLLKEQVVRFLELEEWSLAVRVHREKLTRT